MAVWRNGKIRRWIRERANYLSPPLVAQILAIDMLIFLGLGPLIALIVRSFWQVDTIPQWYQFSFGFTLAWLLGFLLPGSPAGIGVREAVFVALFGGELGDGLAAALAVALRIMTTISDLVTFVIASWLGRRRVDTLSRSNSST